MVASEEESGTLVWKITFLIILSVVAWIGMLPLCFPRCITSKHILSFGNTFAAGVFFATALLHILPEALSLYQVPKEYEIIDEHNRNQTEILIVRENAGAFPVIPFVVMCGYTFVLLIEKVAFADFHHALFPHGDTATHSHAGNHDHSGHILLNSIHASEAADSLKDHLHTDPDVDVVQDRDHRNAMVAEPGKNPCTPYLLLMALGIHSVFEGIALGLAAETAEVTALFIAIVAHKLPESFGLSTAFTKANTAQRKALGMAGVFSLLSPLGIITGILLVEEGTVSDQGSAVLIALTTGMFLYVCTTEIIPEEFETGHYKWLKFLCLILGMTFMAVMTFATSHSHDAPHD
jgi:zinc transporter 1/2/3